MTTFINHLDEYDSAIAAVSHQLRRRWILLAAITVIGGLAAGLLSWNAGIGLLIPLLVGFSCYVPVLRRQVRPLWATGKAMAKLATASGARYIEISKPNYQKHFQPAVAKLGLFERHEQIVIGEYEGMKFRTYVDTFRHPFAYRWSRVATRVYELDLPKEFPHIFLRNRRSDNKFFSTVLRHFDDDQRISLEGDFDKYFTAYTHAATTTPALSLLAPNVMQTLIESNRHFDIEIAGNKLYMYTNDYYVTADDLQNAFGTLDAFLKHLNRRLKSWKFVLPNSKHYPYMSSRAGAGTVAIGHTYFNQAWLGIIAYNIYSGFKIWIDSEFWQIKLGLVVISNIVMAIVLLVCRRKYQLSNRNVGR